MRNGEGNQDKVILWGKLLMSDIYNVQHSIENDLESDIKCGVRELYRLFKEDCYIYNQEFTDMVVREVELKSENKKLAQICESIVNIIKSEKD